MKCLITVFVLLFIINVDSRCYWNSGCPYKYFSSKSPYSNVRGDLRDSTIKFKDCEAVSIWGIIRHGNRDPGFDFGENMKRVIRIRDYVVASYIQGKSSLCAQDVENLKKWSINVDMFESPQSLAHEGYQEMVGIAKRLRESHSELLDNLGKDSYTLRPAIGYRMEKSVEGFIEGLGHKDIKMDSEITNDIIAPFYTCETYLKNVRNNPDTYAETRKYENTSDYLVAKDRIQRRLGIDYTLTDENITALYDLCRYTWSGIENKPSPWCALFTKIDLQVLEYSGDLRHYYRNGYGTAINAQFGEIPLGDLMKTFLKAKEGHGNKLTAYFSHATMIDMICSALGIFKDAKPLTGLYRDEKRKWRTSYHAAFGANIIAVLHRCNNGKPIDYKVVFYLNEEPLKSICTEGICTWQEFEEIFNPFVNTTVDKLC